MGLLTFRKVECMGGDVFGRVGLTFGLIWWVLCTMGGYLEPVSSLGGCGNQKRYLSR